MFKFFQEVKNQVTDRYNGVSRTFNETYANAYFRAKINDEEDQKLDLLFKKAIEDIKERYPEAKNGNNYWSGMPKDLPKIDQYFIRYITYRNCMPPYGDLKLNEYEQRAIDEMNQLIEEERIKQDMEFNF